MSPSCVSLLWYCEHFIENWSGYYDAPLCFYFPITTEPNTKVIYHSLCIFFHMRSFWMQHCMKLCRSSPLPLTHWGRSKMAAVLQTTCSDVCLWMKSFVFRFKFHWILFPRVQLTEPMMIILLTHTCISRPQWVYAFKHEQNASTFYRQYFQSIFLIESFCIWGQIPLIFFPKVFQSTIGQHCCR